MFLTTHAAAGILISQHVHNPYAVFGLSFASHFVLDFIPHGDEDLYHDHEWKVLKRYKRVVIINAMDLAGLLGLTLWAISRANLPNGHLLFIGILGSVLPDLLSYFFPIIHQRLNWLFIVRWLYSLTKPTGVRYLVRAQNWMHNLLHHEIIRRDVPFTIGFIVQLGLIAAMLSFSR